MAGFYAAPQMAPAQMFRQKDYEDTASGRRLAEALAKSSMSTSPVGHPLGAVARIAQALAANYRMGKIDDKVATRKTEVGLAADIVKQGVPEYDPSFGGTETVYRGPSRDGYTPGTPGGDDTDYANPNYRDEIVDDSLVTSAVKPGSAALRAVLASDQSPAVDNALPALSALATALDPKKRDRAKDAAGNLRYIDNGKLVFPGEDSRKSDKGKPLTNAQKSTNAVIVSARDELGRLAEQTLDENGNLVGKSLQELHEDAFETGPFGQLIPKDKGLAALFSKAKKSKTTTDEEIDAGWRPFLKAISGQPPEDELDWTGDSPAGMPRSDPDIEAARGVQPPSPAMMNMAAAANNPAPPPPIVPPTQGLPSASRAAATVAGIQPRPADMPLPPAAGPPPVQPPVAPAPDIDPRLASALAAARQQGPAAMGATSGPSMPPQGAVASPQSSQAMPVATPMGGPPIEQMDISTLRAFVTSDEGRAARRADPELDRRIRAHLDSLRAQ